MKYYKFDFLEHNPQYGVGKGTKYTLTTFFSNIKQFIMKTFFKNILISDDFVYQTEDFLTLFNLVRE